MTKSLNKHRELIFRILVSSIVATLSYKLFSSSEAAINAAITILSIFLGFVMTIMTLLADQSINDEATYSEAVNSQVKLKSKLTGYHRIFIVYFVCLMLAVVTLLQPNCQIKIHNINLQIGDIICWLFAFLFTYSMLLTLKLPDKIINFQLQRHAKFMDAKAPKHTKLDKK